MPGKDPQLGGKIAALQRKKWTTMRKTTGINFVVNTPNRRISFAIPAGGRPDPHSRPSE